MHRPYIPCHPSIGGHSWQQLSWSNRHSRVVAVEDVDEAERTVAFVVHDAPVPALKHIELSQKRTAQIAAQLKRLGYEEKWLGCWADATNIATAQSIEAQKQALRMSMQQREEEYDDIGYDGNPDRITIHACM